MTRDISLPGPLILVVDDDPANQIVAVRLLAHLGYPAEAVATGRLAVAAVAGQPYALVLMDGQMPEMDGYAATRAIRQGEAVRGGHVPIIGFTADTSGDVARRCLAAGMDDYLAKPASLAALRATVERWLLQESRSSGNVPPADDLPAPAGRTGLGRPARKSKEMPVPRVLIVEDNPLNRELATDVLEAQGWEVRTAEDAAACRAALAASHPHLVLMDVQLPGEDGLSLTRALRADPSTAALVIVALTAHARPDDEQRAREAGCDGYLAKPINTRTLAHQLAAFLEPSLRSHRDGDAGAGQREARPGR